MARREKNGFPLFGAVMLLISAAAAWERERASDGKNPGVQPGMQTAIASEQGRGRSAKSPWGIPWTGWKDILIRTYEQISKDRLLAVAAGVVYYALLALFPAITALVSLYGLFADPASIEGQLKQLATGVPDDVMTIVGEQIKRISSAGSGQLGFAFFVSLAVALWSANAGMKAMFDALNVAYGEEEERGFIRLNLVSLLFTLGGIIFLLIALTALAVMPIVFSTMGLEGAWTAAIGWLRWPILLAIVVVGLSVMYRFGPSRREPKWRWVTVGGVVAGVVWLIGSGLFSFYLSNFANYNATYGSLGAVIALLIWMWLTTIIVLLGAELNAEIEHQTARDSTIGGSKPLGARRAMVADTVGEARAGRA